MIERDKQAVQQLMDELEGLVAGVKPEVAIAALAAMHAVALSAFADLHRMPFSTVARAMHRHIDELAKVHAGLSLH